MPKFWIWSYSPATKPNFAFARPYAYRFVILAYIANSSRKTRTWLLSKTSWDTSPSSAFGGFVCCKTLYWRKERKFSSRYCPRENPTMSLFQGNPGLSRNRPKRWVPYQLHSVPKRTRYKHTCRRSISAEWRYCKRGGDGRVGWEAVCARSVFTRAWSYLIDMDRS